MSDSNPPSLFEETPELRGKIVEILASTANGCLAELGVAPGLRQKYEQVRAERDNYRGANARLWEDNRNLTLVDKDNKAVILRQSAKIKAMTNEIAFLKDMILNEGSQHMRNTLLNYEAVQNANLQQQPLVLRSAGPASRPVVPLNSPTTSVPLSARPMQPTGQQKTPLAINTTVVHPLTPPPTASPGQQARLEGPPPIVKTIQRSASHPIPSGTPTRISHRVISQPNLQQPPIDNLPPPRIARQSATMTRPPGRQVPYPPQRMNQAQMVPQRRPSNSYQQPFMPPNPIPHQAPFPGYQYSTVSSPFAAHAPLLVAFPHDQPPFSPQASPVFSATQSPFVTASIPRTINPSTLSRQSSSPGVPVKMERDPNPNQTVDPNVIMQSPPLKRPSMDNGINSEENLAKKPRIDEPQTGPAPNFTDTPESVHPDFDDEWDTDVVDGLFEDDPNDETRSFCQICLRGRNPDNALFINASYELRIEHLKSMHWNGYLEARKQIMAQMSQDS